MLKVIVDHGLTRLSGGCFPMEQIKKVLEYKEKLFMTAATRKRITNSGNKVNNKPMYVDKYLFDEFDNSFPTGMLHLIIQVLEKHQFAYEIVDLRNPTFASLSFGKPTGKYAKISPRDYQSEAIDNALFKKRGILRIACGGGKTLCAGEVIKDLRRRAVFLVNRSGLLYQAKEVFEQMLGVPIGQVGDGVVDIKEINVVMIQTLVNYLGKEYESFDEEDMFDDTTDVKSNQKQIQELLEQTEVLFLDECHCIGAKTAYDCITAFKNAEWRVGLSVGGDSVIVIKDAKQKIKTTTIKELASDFNVGLDKIVSLSDNIQVRSYDGQKFVWRRLNAIHKYKCNKKVFEILTDYGRKLRVTEDHSVFRVVKDGYYSHNHHRKYYGKLEEARGDELNIGDYLLLEDNLNSGEIKEINVASAIEGKRFYVSGKTEDFKPWIENNIAGTKNRYRYKNGTHGCYLPLNTFLKSNLPGNKIYTEGARKHWFNTIIPCSAIAYLTGYFIGDGWMDSHRVCFAVPEQDEESFLENIKELFCFSNVGVDVQKKAGRSVEIRLSSKVLRQLFYSMFFDQKVKTKRIPSEIFNWTKESQELVLRGIIDSDGHMSRRTRNRNRVYYTTISEQLALDMCEFLKVFGIIGSIFVGKPELGGIINGRQIKGQNKKFVVNWSHWSQVGINKGRHGKRTALDLRGADGQLAKIRQITEVQESEVFDLTVNGAENFVANGILVHNSATPVREDGKGIFFDACIGPRLANISFTFLIENGFLVQPYICFKKLNGRRLPPHTKAQYKTLYQTGIVNNDYRNMLIATETQSLYLDGYRPLILVQHVKHGNILHDILPEANFIHGNHSVEQRKTVLDQFSHKKIPFVLATTILDEAIDIPACDVVVMAGGGASYARTIQRMSRAMRLDPNNPNKTRCIIVDFFDEDKYLDRHCYVRQNTYRSEAAFKIILPGQKMPFEDEF